MTRPALLALLLVACGPHGAPDAGWSLPDAGPVQEATCDELGRPTCPLTYEVPSCGEPVWDAILTGRETTCERRNVVRRCTDAGVPDCGGEGVFCDQDTLSVIGTSCEP